jgi:hypothetical protein
MIQIKRETKKEKGIEKTMTEKTERNKRILCIQIFQKQKHTTATLTAFLTLTIMAVFPAHAGGFSSRAINELGHLK